MPEVKSNRAWRLECEALREALCYFRARNRAEALAQYHSIKTWENG